MAFATPISIVDVNDTQLPAQLRDAAAIIRAGGTVAFPTETVYGLGADATSNEAVAKIYAAKGRPSFNPLISHIASREAAREHGLFSQQAEALAEAFWPGPLTLVLPSAPGCKISSLARAGLESVALRIPDHPIARALIETSGRPIAAPSANRSGHMSPVTALHVVEDLDGRIDHIVDGGPTRVGLESTIIACLAEGPRLLRPGGITRAHLEAVLKNALPVEEAKTLLAPGMMASHYAPQALIRLDATSLEKDEAGLDFGGRFGTSPNSLDLSPAGDTSEAAAHLFDYLHRLDRLGLSRIAVAPIPDTGLGEAINDRLRRAAAPR